MSTRHLVDPELLPLLDVFPDYTFTSETLAALRAKEMPMPPIEDCGVDLKVVTIKGPGGELTLHVYRPRNSQRQLGCILHIHGGGFVLGEARHMEYVHRPLAAELNCVLVSVDYHLAPETRFPGNVEDCYAALSWVFENAKTIGVDVTRVGVMGESAGGGLAAALALLARDRGEFPLAFQHLIYPMLDDRTCAREPHPLTGEFVWNPEANRFGWTSLLGHEPGLPDVSPYAAAARATDLSRLPPTFISVGTLDLFLDENLDYAARLIRAAVPTELHVWAGAFHGFDGLPGAKVVEAATRARKESLAKFLSPTAKS